MKTQNIFFLALTLFGLVFSSCNKEDENPNTNTTDPTTETEEPSAADLRNFFLDNRENKVQSFTEDASSAISITTNSGSTFNFNPSAFQKSDGTVVSGNIDIDIIELLDKRDMVLTNTPTMGNLQNGGRAPLISGGQFRITASQNGEELELRDWYGVNAQITAPNGVDPNMEIFYGTTTDDTLTWNSADSSLIFGQGSSYQAYFDSINWVNLDYFMDAGGNNTPVEVELPQGFNNTNVALFVSFDGMNALGQLYSFSNGVFMSSPYTIAVGSDVHFIAVAYINGDPHAAIVPATIGSNHYEIIGSLTQTTPAQLQSDIDALP
jgi:hypothetical protein